MPNVDPGRLTGRCPRHPGLDCPASPCLGASDPRACDHLANLSAWRSLPAEAQFARLGGGRPGLDPRLRDAVNACPDRGPVLPISQQDDCGCLGRELSECRSGRGKTPGRVTLRDCLDCRGAVAG